MRYLAGLGNYTQTDDAIGPRLIEHVVTQGIEQGFVALDLAGRTLDLVHYLTAETMAMVIVDCARMGLVPGEFRFFTPDDVATQKLLAGISTHEGDLLPVVALARQLGYPIPPLVVMGIEPVSTEPGLELSPLLAAQLDGYARVAIARLRELPSR